MENVVAESTPVVRVSKSKRAGCVISVARIERNLRKGNYAKKVRTASAVFMAAVLEYLSAEVLELAGYAARRNGRTRIIPRDIMEAVENDEELSDLLKDVQISAAGVAPFIHEVLLTPKSKVLRNPKNRTLTPYD